MNAVHIGTSGFSYQHWVDVLYPPRLPQKQWFEHYCTTFHTVELNNTFYHLPPAKTFASWRRRSPDDFVVTVKGSRYTTHMKKLVDARESVLRFVEHAKELKEKMGIILYQLPPSLKIDMPLLKAFLACLPAAYRFALEFRNETWFDDKVYSLLDEHGVSFCIYDMPSRQSPSVVTSDVVYIRFHGSTQLYGGSYPEEVLEKWADIVKSWAADGKEIFVYFNNDFGGHAVRNALTLRSLVEFPPDIA